MVVTTSTRIASGELSSHQCSESVPADVKQKMKSVKTLADAIVLLESEGFMEARTDVGKEFTLTIYEKDMF